MFVTIRENDTGKPILAKIVEAEFKKLPLKKNGWQFSWRQLSKIEGALIYKLVLLDSPETIEGLILAVVENGEMLSMKNIEVSPLNYGNSGKFKDIAGCLIAFACELSFQLGKGDYNGFLTFESKTVLVEFYKKKYGAIQAGGHMMFIDDKQGKNLIKKYLEK